MLPKNYQKSCNYFLPLLYNITFYQYKYFRFVLIVMFSCLQFRFGLGPVPNLNVPGAGLITPPSVTPPTGAQTNPTSNTTNTTTTTPSQPTPGSGTQPDHFSQFLARLVSIYILLTFKFYLLIMQYDTSYMYT